LFCIPTASIMKIVTNFSNGNESVTELTLSQEASTLVAQYKNIIREQDGKIQSINERVKELQSQNESLTVIQSEISRRLTMTTIFPLQAKLFETNTSMSQLSDQNILLKAQLSAAGAGQVSVNQSASDDRFKLDQMQQQIQSLMAESSHQKTKINFYEAENLRLLGELEQSRGSQSEGIQLRSENEELKAKVSAMGKDQEDLLELLADQELKLKDYRRKLRALGQQLEPSDDEN
jgi:chromosome segregation ATPase